jgi:hypothetical protein
MDCKAVVNIGDYARGGKTRGNARASDHDLGCEEKYIPCGILDEDTGALHISFGSSYKTSDFIVDTVEQWWTNLLPLAQQETRKIQIKVDNGPESSGVRTQFLNRIVSFASEIGKAIHRMVLRLSSTSWRLRYCPMLRLVALGSRITRCHGRSGCSA